MTSWLSSNPSGVFDDRRDAGQRLAARLAEMKLEDPVVLALPRGGVPVALEICKSLDAPLDLIFVRKIGVPIQPELAAAAVVNGERPELVRNEEVIEAVGVSETYLDRAREEKLREIADRRRRYLGDRAALPISGRTAIIVDDGLATGTTARAAIKATRRLGAARIVLAVPVAPSDTVADLAPDVDDVVCLETPTLFAAIGQFYRDFTQIEDSAVVDMLKSAPTSGDSS